MGSEMCIRDRSKSDVARLVGDAGRLECVVAQIGREAGGLKLDVAETAMQYNIQQVDRRISAHNYRALWKAQDTLQRLGVIKSVFDVNKHIEPKFILSVMKTHPDLFADLQPIPAEVAINPGFVFKP